MEQLSRPAPAVTGANLNIANPQRRTGDDGIAHEYATGTQETKAAVTTTTTPLPTASAPPVQRKWLLWILFVLRCISLIMLLLVFICLIYGSSLGRHFVPAYIFVSLITVATSFTQYLNGCILFARGRIPFPPQRTHLILVGVVEVMLVGLAVATVLFPLSINNTSRGGQCGWRYSSDDGAEARERYEARSRSFACLYTGVWAGTMFGVGLVHLVLMVLSFVQVCITRKVVVHPDVVLVGQQPRSGRYV